VFASIKKIFGIKTVTPSLASAADAEPPSEASQGKSPDANAAMDFVLPAPAELRLEALFAQAAHEPKKRTDFLNALMEAELHVIGQKETGADGTINIQLATQTAGDEQVAIVFTSRSAMQKAGAPDDQPTVSIKAPDFVRMISGNLGFLLNPSNRVAKQFTKFEVEQLAGGKGSVQEVPIDPNLQLSVRQPDAYPPGLLAALASAASEIELITTIHTGLMSTSENAPQILLAVISTVRELPREEFLGLVNLISQKLASLMGAQSINFAPLNPGFTEMIERRALINVTEALS
jgi:hypothetical protein